MGLEEGPKADGRDPTVHIPPSINLQRLPEAQLHLDSTRVVGDGTP
jgi:hypothetical protein